MASEDTKIACWKASKWTTFLGSFQIILASFGIIGLCVMLAGGELPEAKIDHLQLTKGMMIVMLVILILHVALNILLLIGNQKEKGGLMLTWLVYTVIALALTAVGAFMKVAEGDMKTFLQNMASAAISAFTIYVVHLRMQDIKASSGGRTGKV